MVRERGYAEDHEEYVEGLRCVAAPIRGPGGRTIAAMSVSIPIQRASEATLRQVRDLLLDGAAQVSARMGLHRVGDLPQQLERLAV